MFALQFPAIKLDQRLFDLGAKRIIEKGLGNDQHLLGYAFSTYCFVFAIYSCVISREFKCHIFFSYILSNVFSLPDDRKHLFVGSSKAIPKVTKELFSYRIPDTKEN